MMNVRLPNTSLRFNSILIWADIVCFTCLQLRLQEPLDTVNALRDLVVNMAKTKVMVITAAKSETLQLELT